MRDSKLFVQALALRDWIPASAGMTKAGQNLRSKLWPARRIDRENVEPG
jgi:hypothetical protein